MRLDACGHARERKPAVQAQDAALQQESTLLARQPELIGALALLRFVDHEREAQAAA